MQVRLPIQSTNIGVDGLSLCIVPLKQTRSNCVTDFMAIATGTLVGNNLWILNC